MGLFSSQIALKKVVPLCRQLATSYDAGIPILRSLELVIRNQKDKNVRDVFERMHSSIGNGSTLAEAVRAEKKYLPTFFIELLATGEKGGKIDIMLRDLAQYFEDQLEMRRETIRAMTYPIIQLIAAWFIGTFALGIIGGIKDVFTQRGGSGFSFDAYIQQYLRFQGGALLIFGIVFAVCVVLSRAGLFGYVWGLFATYMWPMSRVTRMFGLARFFRSMSLLIGSGLRIDHCIENSATVTGNPYMEKQLLKAVSPVKDGATLVEAFSNVNVLLPQSREMLHVGEVSGQLEAALRKASEYHLAEAMHAAAIARRVLGVAISLTVAGLVGFVIIKFYLTYFSMIEGVMNDL
ncbi:MAG: type II secretion system F family protein [Candidatus Hydrogenedentes bacterium]|nr:type II secretion system F family protein [Candidatus Hydrogenedentota bacterium]